MSEQTTISADDLVYAATARCECGAGLAYAPGDSRSYWDCSAILLGEAIPSGQPGAVRHCDRRPFAFWEIKSEQQPSAHGMTTRPESPATALTGKAAVIEASPAGDVPPTEATAFDAMQHLRFVQKYTDEVLARPDDTTNRMLLAAMIRDPEFNAWLVALAVSTEADKSSSCVNCGHPNNLHDDYGECIAPIAWGTRDCPCDGFVSLPLEGADDGK